MVVWGGRSERRGILLVVFWQCRLLDHALEVCFGVSGRTTVPWCGRGDFGQKSSASAPAPATPMGVMTLLTALLWLPLKRRCFSWKSMSFWSRRWRCFASWPFLGCRCGASLLYGRGKPDTNGQARILTRSFFVAGVWWSRQFSIFYMWLSCHRARPSFSAGKIGAPWPGARGEAFSQPIAWCACGATRFDAFPEEAC
jgi:hypothetical protein